MSKKISLSYEDFRKIGYESHVYGQKSYNGVAIISKIEVKNIIEKPDPKNAPSNIAVVGRYIVEPSVFDHLALQKLGTNGEIQLTDSLSHQIG